VEIGEQVATEVVAAQALGSKSISSPILIVSRARRSTKRSEVVRRRPGIDGFWIWDDPGSAVHRFALHRIRETAKASRRT